MNFFHLLLHKIKISGRVVKILASDMNSGNKPTQVKAYYFISGREDYIFIIAYLDSNPSFIHD